MKSLLLVVSLLIASISHAAEYSRSNVTVNSILAMAVDRPARTNSQGYIRLYLNDGAWMTGSSESSCKRTNVDIAKEDTHLVSIMLTAMALNQQLVIGVDHTLLPIDDTCQAIYLQAITN